jgi:tetratricopeptide (TPR) repeat protein
MISRTKLDAWTEALIEAGWLAALTVAPLFFNVFSSRVFEPDKISLIRTIALVMLVAWIVRAVDSGRLWLPGNVTGDGGAAPGRRGVLGAPFLLSILLLVIAYFISTIFSVAPFVSWFGSYQRLQGTYTFLAYVVIALAVMAHLRHTEQLRRMRHVIIVTSLPIAIYGIIQHFGQDPLPWGGDVQTRIAANAGNAIFLSAYLIMALFFTLERVYSSFAHLLRQPVEDKNQAAEGQDMPAALAGGAYLFIFMVQALAIFWTQSRGPLLGLLTGMYLFVLLLFSALRPRRYRAWVTGWVGVGLAGMIVLVLMNTTSMFGFVESVGSLRRLSHILDLEANTAQVRVLIWQGAAELVSPHAPLDYPDGSTDKLNPVRPLIGYGPEAMWVAFNPFYPPDLAHHEKRNASPDRSHNEPWDSLVITGVFGFLAYMSLFIAIFYWALRWLGLLVNRRDKWLFGILLAAFSLALIILFTTMDGGLRFLGVALPAGLVLGLVVYVTIAAFLHNDLVVSPDDIPRQLLILTILATVVAHFVEIHFGIAIAATRVYFWVTTGLLLTVGMRWVQPGAFAGGDEAVGVPAAQGSDSALRSQASGKKRRSARKSSSPAAHPRSGPPVTTATVMTDLLIFMTFAFIYMTNSAGLKSAVAILTNSVTKRAERGELVASPALFFMLIFTWLVAATLGMTTESLRHRKAPGLGWWLRGYLVHGLIVWSGWLIYGLYQAHRLIPGIGGSDLTSQLNQVAGHFAVYTWLLVIWLLVAATVYAWPWLRTRGRAVGKRLIFSLGAGVVAAIAIFFIITSVNIELVRADIIYKQGQQFDSQRNWVSSVELYRRALAARKTEDHYMLFLGRSLLERAKEVDNEGTFTLPENPTIDDILALNADQIAAMGRQELLRAAETVLLEAQTVNPLNTDHTANLARLYRTWADLSPDDPELKQAMLDKSIEEYNLAVTLSPNAAHLWNEKGNARLARGERDLAEESYLHSLALDQLYDQTYLLLADFYSRQGDDEKAVELLKQGIEAMDASPRFRPTVPMYSYLGVAQARSGDTEGAIESYLAVINRRPKDVAALRNLAILYRDLGEPEEGAKWVEQALEVVNPQRLGDLRDLHKVAIELYQQIDDDEGLITHYQALRELDPTDANILRNLYNLYLKQENWNQAVETLQALMQLEPDEYHHPLAMAQILAQNGQPDAARQFAERALELAPPAEQPGIQTFLDGLAP